MKSISNKKFKRVERDKYYTWFPIAHEAINRFLPKVDFTYIEPCAGAGDLIRGISNVNENGRCVQAIDVKPDNSYFGSDFLKSGDATQDDLAECDFVITNPPFSRVYKPICFSILKRSIDHADVGVWFLLPFNWACNKDFVWAMKKCERVVPIGRMKWMKNSPHSESKDSAWFYFTKKENHTIMELQV